MDGGSVDYAGALIDQMSARPVYNRTPTRVADRLKHSGKDFFRLTNSYGTNLNSRRLA